MTTFDIFQDGEPKTPSSDVRHCQTNWGFCSLVRSLNSFDNLVFSLTKCEFWRWKWCLEATRSPAAPRLWAPAWWSPTMATTSTSRTSSYLSDGSEEVHFITLRTLLPFFRLDAVQGGSLTAWNVKYQTFKCLLTDNFFVDKINDLQILHWTAIRQVGGVGHGSQGWHFRNQFMLLKSFFNFPSFWMLTQRWQTSWQNMWIKTTTNVHRTTFTFTTTDDLGHILLKAGSQHSKPGHPTVHRQDDHKLFEKTSVGGLEHRDMKK